MPLLCWRYKVKFNIEQGRLSQPDTETDMSRAKSDVNASKMSVLSQIRDQSKTASIVSNPYQKFAILDVWRDDVMAFLEQESGTFISSDR